jgi:transglutaminase-like putative cysteine protease
MFVSFFLILANFFYSQTIAMALVMALTVVAVLTTQVSFQYAASAPPLLQRLRAGGLIFGLAIPVTLVMFLLFPRIQGPLWTMPNDAGAGRTGLSDTMSPGNISQLAGSDEVAFRVSFKDPLPKQQNLYWRGVVLRDFDGRTWRQAPSLLRPRRITVNWRGKPVRQQITLEPSGRPWLYALDLAQAPPQIASLQTGFSPELQILTIRPVTERLRYDVTSVPEFELQPQESEVNLQPWLALPYHFNPKAQALAEKMRSETGSDIELINKVLKYFRQEQFRYTLNPPLLGEHTVDEFLFNTRAGFCEHYASAFVVLMRAGGIPARVMTGYQGGEINPVDGLLTVRQSDAHAWAEVWLRGHGWKRVDPTAAVSPLRIEKNLATALPRSILGGLIALDLTQDSLLGKLRNNWEAVNNQWNQLVLNYSVDKQKDFIRALGFENADWSTMVGLLFAAGSLAMAAVVTPLLWNRQKIDPAAALYRMLCNDMAKRGLPRALHEGPRAYAERIAANGHALSAANLAAVTKFLALYESLLYAPQQANTLDQSKRRTRIAPAVIQQLKSLLAESR